MAKIINGCEFQTTAGVALAEALMIPSVCTAMFAGDHIELIKAVQTLDSHLVALECRVARLENRTRGQIRYGGHV